MQYNQQKTSNPLKSLYFALVHSHLVYGIQIWSVAPQKSLNQLNIFQKKCIRIITERKTGILRLQDLITYFKLLFMYDYLNEHLPISFRHIWILNEQYRLTHNPLEGGQRALRNDNELFVPFIRLDSFMCFPLSDFPRTWNNFDNLVIKAASTRTQFKILLKSHFVSLLNDNIVCGRLLCPSCHLQQN